MDQVGLIRIDSQTREIELPFSIGHSTKHAIYVMGEGGDHTLAYVVADRNRLRAYDPDDHELSRSALQILGIELLACYRPEAGKWQRLLAREHQLGLRLPKALAALCLYNLPRGLRYLGFLALLLSLGSLVGGELLDTDLMRPSTVGALKVETLSNGITHPGVFGLRHRAGVIFKLQANADEAVKPGKISFRAAGLIAPASVEMLVNGEVHFRSRTIEDCALNPCVQEVVLPPETLKEGDNLITFRHDKPHTKWALSQVKFESYRPMTMVEERRFNLYLAEATELFEKRDISPYNLIAAGRTLRKISEFSATLYLPPSQRTALELLTGEVRSHVETFLTAFWFNNEKKIVSGQLEAAQEELLQLARYFPDTSSVQGAKIEKQMERVHRLMGSTRK